MCAHFLQFSSNIINTSNYVFKGQIIFLNQNLQISTKQYPYKTILKIIVEVWIFSENI